MQLLKEHQWMAKNPKELEKHRGKWIAILNGNIIAEGNSYLEVFSETKEKFPKQLPLITYVLNKDEEQMIAFL